MTITSGTFPFATSGAYRFLPSALDGSYAIVPISGDVDPSTGTHTYTKTGANTATLALTDIGVGALTAACTFSTPNSGTYLLTSTAAPGASQSGTFALYAGPSPATIAGATVTVTITSGEPPFAEFGSYRFQPAASGNTYANTALSGDVGNSSGTYSYTQDSAYTGFISYNDTVAGPGFSCQLSFDSPTTGTVFLRKSGSSGYQTGLFSMAAAGVGPSITEHPATQTAELGASVTFRVSATGTTPLTYQWRKNGVAILGATGSTFTIAFVTGSDAGAYDVVVSNAYGTRTSSQATLTVDATHPPLTLLDEGNLGGFAGMHLFFNVTIPAGEGELRLETSGGTGDCDLFIKRGSQPALFDFAAYDDESRHRKAPGGPEDGNEELIEITDPHEGTYYILVYDYSEFEGVRLVVTLHEKLGPPTILLGPHDVTVFDGQMAQFAVQAAGTAPLTYEWRKNGQPVPGAIGRELIIAEVARSDAGEYDVVVSNSLGSVTSDPAVLMVRALPYGTPAAWMRSFGITGDPVEAELGDPDKDGHATWQEYVAGTDPINAQSVLQIRAASRQGDYFTFKVPTELNRTCQIEYSDDLYGWHTLIEELGGNGTAITIGDPRLILGTSNRFYRVAIPGPPPGVVLIPGGSFEMGDSFGEGDGDERPVHTVSVSAFYMDKYEVTKALWDEVYQWAVANGYAFDYRGFGKATNHPVHSISWHDAVKWCNARSEKEGRSPAYYTNDIQTAVYRTGRVDLSSDQVKWRAGYRLPTEAEWEKAARGGLAGKRFPWGDTISQRQANYESYWRGGKPVYAYDVNSTRGIHPDYTTGEPPNTSPAGSFAANGYGLADVAGNVVEWCWDWYGGYSSSMMVDPRGPVLPKLNPRRVMRGGHCVISAWYCRVATRWCCMPGAGSDVIGFRCVLPST